MTNKNFGLKEYWSLFKLSCRPLFFSAPGANKIKLFIAAYFLFYLLLGTFFSILFLHIGNAFRGVVTLFLYGLIIINPYYFKYALHYKTSDWFRNTGYLPSEVCADIGLFGEYHATIDYSNLKGKYGKLYNGLIIPKPDGSFTELDLVMVSQYGIFVVEAKARGGSFYGHILDEKWRQQIGSQQNELQNPVIQNQNHINFLYLYLYKMKKADAHLVDITSFWNDIYFASDAQIHVENQNSTVRIIRSSRKAIKIRDLEFYEGLARADVEMITDILDALPQYTREEKRNMFVKREVQYRNGAFSNRVVYYSVQYISKKSSHSREEKICMDAGSYQLYQFDDGLWRAIPDIRIIRQGKPCDTLKEAVMQQKAGEWMEP